VRADLRGARRAGPRALGRVRVQQRADQRLGVGVNARGEGQLALEHVVVAGRGTVGIRLVDRLVSVDARGHGGSDGGGWSVPVLELIEKCIYICMCRGKNDVGM
jgi:hypothetical protein